ncbi:MAG: hypothetical protein MZW92_03270 [Comamonadaceae bacterium]|nr:hypothetical protein [Comamonadaceae bacterium]
MSLAVRLPGPGGPGRGAGRRGHGAHLPRRRAPRARRSRPPSSSGSRRATTSTTTRPLDEFMIPTVLVIDGESRTSRSSRSSTPSGRRARFSYSEAELVVYDGEVVLGALVKARGRRCAARTARAQVRPRATRPATTMSCLPPKELAFEIAVPGRGLERWHRRPARRSSTSSGSKSLQK